MRGPTLATIVGLLVLFVFEQPALAELTKEQCVASNENAQNLRDKGKLREARADLAICIAASCPAPVRQDCAERIADVDRAMPTVVFEVTDGAGFDVTGVRLRVDGDLVASSLDGEAVPIDPGIHVLRFLFPGGQEQEESIVMREGQKARRARIVQTRPLPRSRTQRTVAAVTLGAGVAGIVAGGVLGLAAKLSYDGAVSGECHGDPHACSAAGVNDVGSARAQAVASTAAFIGGSALVVGGVVLWVAADHGISVVPTPGGASLGFQGVF